MCPRPCVSETDVVVLPSPTERSTLALYLPYRSYSSGSSPSSSAISAIGRRVASWAISRLLGICVAMSLLGRWSVRDGRGGQLGHERVGVEALERERRD